MPPRTRWLHDTPWAKAAAGYAWGAAVVLTVLIEPGTLMFVIPPALVATVPLVVPQRQRMRTSLLAAVVLAAWAVLGITLLGLYFLPSAALLAAAYVHSRQRMRSVSI